MHDCHCIIEATKILFVQSSHIPTISPSISYTIAVLLIFSSHPRPGNQLKMGFFQHNIIIYISPLWAFLWKGGFKQRRGLGMNISSHFSYTFWPPLSDFHIFTQRFCKRALWRPMGFLPSSIDYPLSNPYGLGQMLKKTTAFAAN